LASHLHICISHLVESGRKPKAEKPLRLKDQIRNEVLTKGENAFKEDSDDDDDLGLTGSRKKMAVSAQKLGSVGWRRGGQRHSSIVA
jgi:hypothetical protein